ncbi:MAG TPA: T9SS type A sorting domain-containing protein, partial [Bacteroidia bacterium]|nr:T9SS type A sorting domain-containing protein [Bacteroidia bacterium]
VDPGCMWYQLPNMATAIDTVSGLWVKPLVTTTYVVRQELDCSALKWDTVVIYANPVGMNEGYLMNENLKIYPVPARDEIALQFTLPGVDEQFKTITIYNKLGQLLREEEPRWLSGSKNKTATIVTSELEQGVYYLRLTSVNSRTVSKKFLIAR